MWKRLHPENFLGLSYAIPHWATTISMFNLQERICLQHIPQEAPKNPQHQWSTDHIQFDETEFKMKLENDPISTEVKRFLLLANNEKLAVFEDEAAGEVVVNQVMVSRVEKSENATSMPKVEPSKNTKKSAKCHICDIELNYEIRMIEHLNIVHGIAKAFECNECSRSFSTPRQLKQHVKIHKAQIVYSCDECDYKSLHKVNIGLHQKRHHWKDYSVFCEICEKGFIAQGELKAHLISHEVARPFACTTCGKSFKSKDHVKGHVRTLHPEMCSSNTVKKYSCEICGQSFSHKPLYYRHKQDEHGEKNCRRKKQLFLCDLCGKAVTSLASMQVHRRIHTGEKPFTCEVCGKCFASMGLLKTHNITHSGERKHTCDDCGKTFTQRSTLVVHKRYHSGERPYVCIKCNKGFVTRTILNLHLKSRRH
ncbi:zinc finger protein OZF-like isoform X1 [Neodiprion fabricii]|uniref:zinc finger protein OZF-like isoform X1 n=2 Tax=Neodiprion fabricii TaxID=2872261 RepID=UPI001ED93CD3|nr:zinc finger protein OZF-like isoform X1 [Neodiprion fabricii]